MKGFNQQSDSFQTLPKSSYSPYKNSSINKTQNFQENNDLREDKINWACKLA